MLDLFIVQPGTLPMSGNGLTVIICQPFETYSRLMNTNRFF